MAIHTKRISALQVAGLVLLAWMHAGAQPSLNHLGKNNNRGEQSGTAPNNTGGQNNRDQNHAPNSSNPGADYSGMYSFLHDGEFVQVTVEDREHVIGFVSRYANSEGEGQFLEQFFKLGKLDGNQLTFTTETVNGLSFEFRGAVERGEGKSRSEEAYYVLKGTLDQNSIDQAKKTSSRSREVVLKSFPQNMGPPPADKK